MGSRYHRPDGAPQLPGLLDVQSFFSEGRAVSSPRRLAAEAAAAGFKTVALVDHLSVGGIVELHQTAERVGITAITGATVPLEIAGGMFPVALLCSSRAGFQHLNQLITLCRYDGQEAVSLAQLAELGDDLHLLTGGRGGFLSVLLGQQRRQAAHEAIEAVKAALPRRVFVQLYFDFYRWDTRRVTGLAALARDTGTPTVCAPQVRHALQDDYRLYDAMVCARLGISVRTPHPERPQNMTRCVSTPRAWGHPAFWEPMPHWYDAIATTAELCRDLPFGLRPERMVPPRVEIPTGLSADEHLWNLCVDALPRYYEGKHMSRAGAVLERELAAIRSQGFAELFLACREVVQFCDQHGILSSARGSAAASITCRLLGISKIDPLAHNLLFERFLFQGQHAAPDIDIDVSSERRDEVLTWMETRFGIDGGTAGERIDFTEAMVSNRITYRAPLAIQDLGRALDLPPHVRDALTRKLGRDYRRKPPHRLREADELISEVLGDAPVKEVLYKLLGYMEPGYFRHFAPHSGGVVISEKPLSWYSPQYRSANGIRALQFDKDDVEWLGLIKLDVLALRALSALEMAVAEVRLHEGVEVDIWRLASEQRDADAIWDLIGSGDTMTLFQIESPGQMGLSTVLKVRTMQELADQEALHRPGPIQVGSRRPYVARKLGKELVTYIDPVLAPILGKTQGVLLYQEQVLRIAHHVAGMPWPLADRFRKKVQKGVLDEEAEELRSEFIAGVARTHPYISEDAAERIYEMCAAFTGYGFAESHSVAFATITYATAWFLLRYPAEWFAAFFSVHPGMWPRQTLRMTAKRKGVPLLGVNVNRSAPVFRVERLEDGTKAVRMSLTSVKGLSERTAQEIAWEARLRPFTGASDLLQRVDLRLDVAEGLIRAGGLDTVQERRKALFDLYALRNLYRDGQVPLLTPDVDRPTLQPMGTRDHLAWDLELTGMSASSLHPVDFVRSQLRDVGALPLAMVKRNGKVRTAGLIVGLQKPPTARGFAFAMIEDGTRLAQVVIKPDMWAESYRLLRDAKILVIEGKAQVSGVTLTLQAEALLPVGATAEHTPAGAYKRSGW